MFKLTELKDRYEKELGYQLFKDSGELSASYRMKNEVIHPVCGIFRVNPMTVTAIPSPFIGIASAEIEMVVVPERIEEVEKKMNDTAMNLNGTSFFIEDDDITYAVTYALQTASVGEKTDIPWYNGAILPIRQTITYTIIEGGFPSSEVELMIDGYTVPFMSLSETKVHTTSVYPDMSGRGTTASEMSALGLDFTIPHLIDDPLSEIISDHLDRDRGNRALCVELKKAGKSIFRIMSIVSVSESVQSPQNVGLNVSLAELSEIAGVFNDLWTFSEVSGAVAGSVRKKTMDGVVVFWGDGTAEKDPEGVHFYSDGKDLHTVITFDLSDGYAYPKTVESLYGVTLYAGELRLVSPTNGKYYLKTANGEGIVVHNHRISFALLNGSGDLVYYPIDKITDDGVGEILSGQRIVVPFPEKITYYDDELILMYRKREREDL